MLSQFEFVLEANPKATICVQTLYCGGHNKKGWQRRSGTGKGKKVTKRNGHHYHATVLDNHCRWLALDKRVQGRCVGILNPSARCTVI